MLQAKMMSKIISIHAFRGGTGKSNITANLAALLATEGCRVGIIDTDIQSPGIHVLFDLDEHPPRRSLNDYLRGKCQLQDTTYNVTPQLKMDVPGQLMVIPKGQLFLIPSSVHVDEISRVLREGYDVHLLNEGMRKLIRELALDVLLIDTHPGLNEETLLSIAVSDALVIVLRPDQQDYQGTGVTIDVARKLAMPHLMLIVNQVPTIFDFAAVKAQMESTYDCEVAAVLPHSNEILSLGSAGLFVQHYPDHPITQSLRQVAVRLMQ